MAVKKPIVLYDGELKELAQVDSLPDSALGARVRYTGQWVNQEYVLNDLAFQGNYAAIANKTTTDNLEPQPIGTPGWTVPDIPIWNPLSNINIVKAGVRVSGITEAYLVTKIRLWIATVTADTLYRITQVDNLTGKITVGRAFNGTVLAAPGWYSAVSEVTWLLPGSDTTLYVTSQNSSSSTLFNHPWVWSGSSNQEVDPGNGNANRRGDNSVLRISELDDDGISRVAELGTVTVGSTLKITAESGASKFLNYEILSKIDEGAWWSFQVVLLDTGALGEPGIERCQLYFDIPVAVSTDHVSITDHYLNAPSLSGLLQLGEAAPVENNDARGIDIEFQKYTVSPDWDLFPRG